ncbi:MAG: ATP-dependent zinc metalloprotease FtsH, partial [Solirubrobacteraceae bacterium]
KYGELLADAREGNVQSITDEGLRVTAMVGGQERTAVLPSELTNVVEDLGCGAGGDPGQFNCANLGATEESAAGGILTLLITALLPVLLIGGFIFFMMRQAQGTNNQAMSFGKSRARMFLGNKTVVTFNDVAGVDEAKQELTEVVEFLKYPEKFNSLGARIPRGVLLVGPPGTGKTLLARAVAGEAGVPFFSISGSEFVEMFVGVGASRVRDLFEQAKRNSPCIVFVDEIDAVGRQRGAGLGGSHDEREQTLNQILVEMDGFGGDAGLVVMGATNRPDILDDALLRPGRFDRQVTVGTPDVHGRLEILNLHAGNRPLGPETDLQEIARLTPGFSGAELANVINEAALLTVREGRTEIDQKTLEEAIDRVVAGPAKKHILTREERWLIAVHEASHAVVTRAVGQTIAAQKLSIVARGRQLGTAAHMLTDRDQVIRRRPDLDRELVSIMAGAAGEQMCFGHLSTGVHDDLHHATSLARSMVTQFGMSEKLGPVTIGEKQGEVFLGAGLQELGQIAPATLELIDRETEAIAAGAFAKAEEVLEANWGAVEETANALLEQETLSGVALDAVLSTVQMMPIEGLGLGEDDEAAPPSESPVADGE